jgi:lipopolysaccharide transport system ATP-binding protein
MLDIVIKAENIGKKYIIGHQAERGGYTALRDVLMQNARTLWNKTKDLATGKPIIQGDTMEEAWALKDVSFEIRRGEAVGIIGRNGAGKSTLLKILSRITEPSTGRVTIKGRVASLLEVGTGFHPELSGRENIYLNGTILGMTRVEIRKKFDEIVAFAEVEKYLDTPVKRYSSGMYVRLAFAVAAHLEPEILVVDEVLAVGDAAFQKKCLGKMGDVAKDGRTVLFVSHNMAAIRNLCIESIYLKNGRIVLRANTENTISNYLSDIQNVLSTVSLRDRKDRQGNGNVKVVDFYINDWHGNKQETLNSGGDYIFVMEYEKINAISKISNAIGSIGIKDINSHIVLLFRSNFTNQNFTISRDKGLIECKIHDLNLSPGIYNIIVFLSNGEVETLDLVNDAAQIIVEGGDYFGTGSIGLPSHCKVLTRTNWNVL